MKNIKLFIVVCLLAVAATVNAQYTSLPTTSSVVVITTVVDTEEWQELKFSYNRYTIRHMEQI